MKISPHSTVPVGNHSSICFFSAILYTRALSVECNSAPAIDHLQESALSTRFSCEDNVSPSNPRGESLLQYAHIFILVHVHVDLNEICLPIGNTRKGTNKYLFVCSAPAISYRCIFTQPRRCDQMTTIPIGIHPTS